MDFEVSLKILFSLEDFAVFLQSIKQQDLLLQYHQAFYFIAFKSGLRKNLYNNFYYVYFQRFCTYVAIYQHYCVYVYASCLSLCYCWSLSVCYHSAKIDHAGGPETFFQHCLAL